VILVSHGCIYGADVINTVAFGINTGALDYTEQDDGTVKLATQDFLQVINYCGAAHDHDPPLPVSNSSFLYMLSELCCDWQERGGKALCH